VKKIAGVIRNRSSRSDANAYASTMNAIVATVQSPIGQSSPVWRSARGPLGFLL
jgi:hypothetical protein